MEPDSNLMRDCDWYHGRSPIDRFEQRTQVATIGAYQIHRTDWMAPRTKSGNVTLVWSGVYSSPTTHLNKSSPDLICLWSHYAWHPYSLSYTLTHSQLACAAKSKEIRLYRIPFGLFRDSIILVLWGLREASLATLFLVLRQPLHMILFITIFYCAVECYFL